MSAYRKIYPISRHELIGRHLVLDDCETCHHPHGSGRLHSLTVKRHLGSGVYGSVFLAVDNHTGDEFAVKAFYVPNDEHYDVATDPLFYEALGHARASEYVPGVVKFHGVIHDYGSPYFFFVMDYHPGGDLESLMDDHSEIFYRREWLLTSLALQVTEALMECHNLNLYHRDLKSDNVLISPDRTRIWISDFGLCTENRTSRPWSRAYSAFMSPESSGTYLNLYRYNNKTADVYSLGILLTQLVTGHTPWMRPSERDPYYAYFLSQPDDFFTHVFPLTPEAGRLLAGLLHPQPASRTRLPQVLRELRALERWYMTDAEMAHVSPELREFDRARRLRAAAATEVLPNVLPTPPRTPSAMIAESEPPSTNPSLPPARAFLPPRLKVTKNTRLAKECFELFGPDFVHEDVYDSDVSPKIEVKTVRSAI